MKEILTPLEMADKLLKNLAFGLEAIAVGECAGGDGGDPCR